MVPAIETVDWGCRGFASGVRGSVTRELNPGRGFGNLGDPGSPDCCFSSLSPPGVAPATMIEVVCNDRLGKKVRVKCNTDDTIGDLKKLIAAQTGTRWNKIVLKKW